MNETSEKIDNLRKMAGTLPSEKPDKKTNVLQLRDSFEIELVDHSENPFRAMFLAATATWGDNDYKNKWNITSPEGKLEVVKAVLTHNTLPQAREVANFFFRVKGVPRWLFDYHTQAKFTTFMSVGCRDNNKLDADIVLSFNETNMSKTQMELLQKEVFEPLKELYGMALDSEGASWQSARSFLPQSYSHSYFFNQNLLAFVNTFAAFKPKENDSYDETEKLQNLKYLYSFAVDAIKKFSPLLGQYASFALFGMGANPMKQVIDYITSLEYKDLSDLDKRLFENTNEVGEKNVTK